MLNERDLTDDSKRIFLASPHMSSEGYEKKFINLAFEKNFIAPLGENVDEFEKELQEKINATNAVALSSGTSAIHMALKSLNIGEGDIVICQSLTFSATANPILYQRATPVFVDSEKETWNMSPESLEKALKKYPKTKAVIVVHIYGMSANMDKILNLCNKYNVPLIEDAAESLGAKYKGKNLGTFGTAGVFSFNGNKIITTSGGGMLIWNKDFEGKTPEEKINKVRFWSTQSRDKRIYYQHSEIGFNYRMSNISAGIGRGQLRVLDERVKQKKYIYNYYKKAFKEIHDIEMMPVYDWEEPNYWLSVALISGKFKPLDMIKKLEEKNIESRPTWKPMHLQPIFCNCDYIDNGGVSEDIFKRGICLPSDTKMTDDDLKFICDAIVKMWN